MASNTHCGRSFSTDFCRLHLFHTSPLRKLEEEEKERENLKTNTNQSFTKKKKVPHLCKKGRSSGEMPWRGKQTFTLPKAEIMTHQSFQSGQEWLHLSWVHLQPQMPSNWETWGLPCDCDNWLWSLGQNSWKISGPQFLICRWSPRSHLALWSLLEFPLSQPKGTGPLGELQNIPLPQTPEPQAQTQERC